MPGELTYRAVEQRDLETICGFPQNARELFYMFPKAEFPLTVEQLAAAVESRLESTVILKGGEIAGFANMYDVVENRYCSIGNVIINPKFRRQGIGEFVMQVMEGIATGKYNVSELRLVCFNGNPGILLYSKLGYHPYGIKRWTDKENEPVALIEMKRTIKNPED